MDLNSRSDEISITLLIPSYKGAKFIRPCLDSVVAQTMDRTKFEVRVVVNGEPDEAVEITHQVLGAADGLQYEVVLVELASLSNARNVGISSAKGNWVTWVDVDDWLSPNYLEELELAARPGIMPVATVVDVGETDGSESRSPIAEQVETTDAGVHEPVELWRPLTFAACKLLPVREARQHLFGVDLRNGEDVAYFAPFVSRFGLKFDNTPARNGAKYYRLVRQGSMSRLKPDFQFSVRDRIAVMRHLDAGMLTADKPMAKLMRSLINAQGMFASRYLESAPDDLSRVVNEFETSDLKYIPWDTIRAPSDRLLISYNYPPFADASAITAAKRAYLSGHQWNVVAQDMRTVRRQDPQLSALTGPSTSIYKQVSGAPAFGSWDAMGTFCDKGTEAIREIETRQGPQRHVYSRAMWPASHFLAAVHKISAEYPVTWRAEFSDPLRLDVEGRHRTGPVKSDALHQKLLSALQARGFDAPPVDSVFAWAEWIAFCLADEIVFTNPLQRASMLSGIGDTELLRRVRDRSIIDPHPTLPSRFYEAQPVDLDLPSHVTNIGYFGTFYANRGLGDALRALATLPGEEQESIRFHIFGDGAESILQHSARWGVSHSVRVHAPLPYLAHLNAARQMDALLVVDADTASHGHSLNPYLPSKLSDYLGTGRPIITLTEPGSMLSRYESRYSAQLNDLDATAKALARLRKDAQS